MRHWVNNNKLCVLILGGACKYIRPCLYHQSFKANTYLPITLLGYYYSSKYHQLRSFKQTLIQNKDFSRIKLIIIRRLLLNSPNFCLGLQSIFYNYHIFQKSPSTTLYGDFFFQSTYILMIENAYNNFLICKLFICL